ncbi:unnamed protein product [Alopecurus aequalis]
MGAGKEEAPTNAGGGGGAEPPQPVVLGMELHCPGCAKKVRKSIHHMPGTHPLSNSVSSPAPFSQREDLAADSSVLVAGVLSVVPDLASNTVVVAGTADAAALKARIESKTKKPVQILSAGPGGGGGKNKPPPAAEPKKSNPDKQQQGGGEEKKSPDKGDKGDKAGASSQPQPPPKEEKKQPPEEKKPAQEPTPTPTTALLRIRLHCDSCADRIRRRIFKIKGVKDVVLDGKDEVKVVGTMDVPAMVAYLNDKLNRAVELAAAAPSNKHGGADDGKKKDKAGGGGDGHVKIDKAADKGKGIEVVGPSVASAAASLAPAPAGASTHHVSPYGYGHVAYPPPQQGPPPGYYNNGYYGGGGNADGGAGYGNGGGFYQQQQQPSSDAGGYYQQQRGFGGGYYDQPRGDAGGYYQQQPGGYEQHPANPPPYQQQPYSSAYGFDPAPPTQMFSDENPNSCSVM